MVDARGQKGAQQLLKQAKLLTALVALKNTQHRREGGAVTMETNSDFKWIVMHTNLIVICIIFKNKNALVTQM